jgi:hypothetical protein
MQPIITLRKLLEQKLNIDSARLSPSTNLKKDLEMSEWEWDYLLNSIEQAWKISLPSSEINEVVNALSFVSHFTDSTKPARLYFCTKRFNLPFSICLFFII